MCLIKQHTSYYLLTGRIELFFCSGIRMLESVMQWSLDNRGCAVDLIRANWIIKSYIGFNQKNESQNNIFENPAKILESYSSLNEFFA